MPQGVHDKHAIGEAHGKAVLTEKIVAEILTAWRDVPKELVTGFIQTMADHYGCSSLAIHNVINLITWKHVTISEVPGTLDPEIRKLLHERRIFNAKQRRKARIYTTGVENVNQSNEGSDR